MATQANPITPVHTALSSLYDTSTIYFNPSLYHKHLTTSSIGQYFLYRNTVTSTMDVVKKEALDGSGNGLIVLAEQQTRGRGRADRVWSSELTGNLYFSLLLRPLAFQTLPQLNLSLPLAVAVAMRGLYQLNAKVKWPNDVWINGKKTAGLLIDLESSGSQIVAACGLGINVNEDMTKSPHEELRTTATSVYNETKSYQPREVLLARICNELEHILQLSMQDMLKLYREYDILVGNDVIVMPKKREDTSSYYTARAIGYTQDGYLIIQKEDGTQVTLVSEEVTIRLK